MKCQCHPKSPFLWARNPRDSIFIADPFFRAKGTRGLTASQIASAFVDEERKKGKQPGTIRGMSKASKELAVIAYKQFGIYTRGLPNVKPTLNKHET